MGTEYPRLDEKITDFISRQRMFFTASAAQNSRINISPRSTDHFRVLDDNTALYLDLTGSGNETAAHMIADGRMTIMFCAFEGAPRILRLYGHGDIIHRSSDEYARLIDIHFHGNPPINIRQLVRLRFDLVKTSCGFGVPLFEYEGERDALTRWAEHKGRDGVEDYWEEKNVVSMDGLPTGILDKS